MAELTSSGRKKKGRNQKSKIGRFMRVLMMLEELKKGTGSEVNVKKIQKKLDEVEPYHGGDPNIFEVPSRLRDLEQHDPYTPGVVSIGPCHHKHKHKHLNEIEKHKWQLLRHLLRRTEKSLDDLLTDKTLKLHDAKECYDKPILEGLTDQQFLEMLLLDACFILELLHNSAHEWKNCDDTSNPLYVFYQRGFIPFIRRDLLMLENQLPFLVLRKIFTIFWDPSAMSIVELALKFFNEVIPGISENISDYSKYERPLHLLDIIHTSLDPPETVDQVSETHIPICDDPSPSNHAARTVLEDEILSDPPPANHATRNVHDEHGERVFHPPPSDHARRTVQNEEGEMMSDPSHSDRVARTVQEDEIVSDPPLTNHETRTIDDEHSESVFDPSASNHAATTVPKGEIVSEPPHFIDAEKTVQEGQAAVSDPPPAKHEARTIPDGKKSTISNSSKIPLHSVHSVTRLRGTGINFEKKDSTKFTEIGFKEGKLLIPPLLIHGSTRSIFLNLMAFEQCYPDCGRHITAYISFMDGLINSSKDVEHLIEKGIIVHQLGSEEDVATLINNLRKEMVFYTNDNYLSKISKQLNEHYEQKWRTWNATLKHEYLKDPWKIISLVAAGLLIFLTMAQTAYTMISASKACGESRKQNDLFSDFPSIEITLCYSLASAVFLKDILSGSGLGGFTGTRTRT